MAEKHDLPILCIAKQSPASWSHGAGPRIRVKAPLPTLHALGEMPPLLAQSMVYRGSPRVASRRKSRNKAMDFRIEQIPGNLLGTIGYSKI